MLSPDPRKTLLSVRHAALLLALGCLLAACDRHTADEVPESYGHGSSHQKSYTDHQIDSRDHSDSFSDTRGEFAHKSPEIPAASATPGPLASPSPTAGSKFFQ
jgi:hypothetical protein